MPKKTDRSTPCGTRTVARRAVLAVAVLAGALAPLPAAAVQQASGTANGSRPTVFMDCQGPNCNQEYYRTEIDWVNWVRDPLVAQVHVIVTSQATGSGGREYRIDLIGREGQADYRDQMLYRALSTDTQRESLDGIVHTLSIALARFASAAGFPRIVTLEGAAGVGVDPGERVVSAEEVTDPWNLWVFRINANGNLEGESTEQEMRVFTSFSASRVTPTWKHNYNGNVSFRRQEVELSDSSLFVDERTDWSLNSLTVFSVAEHWSVGVNVQSGRMTRFNQDFRLTVTPAVEFSFFPYEEATRRALTAFYSIGPTYRDYITRTLLGKLSETRFEESLELEFSQRQTWGDASIRAQGSHLLDDFETNRLSLRGDVEVRIFRGLSVNARGDIEWVNDQIYLSSKGETDEEILLELRQRATDFSYGVQIGFQIQFGSIFNNVVNNRFRGVGGFGGFGRFF